MSKSIFMMEVMRNSRQNQIVELHLPIMAETHVMLAKERSLWLHAMQAAAL